MLETYMTFGGSLKDNVERNTYYECMASVSEGIKGLIGTEPGATWMIC